MKTWLISLLLLLILSFLVAGCWDSRELSNMAIIAAVGIDVSDKPGLLELTIQIIRPGEVKSSSGGFSGGGEGQGSTSGLPQPVWVIKTTGRTVGEAVRKFTSIANREPYFGHNQMIVLGKQAAGMGVRPLLDFFMREHELRETSWILVAEGKAEQIINIHSGLEKIPALGVVRLVEQSKLNSQASSINLQEFIGRLMSKTAAPYASRIEIIKGLGGEKNRLDGTAVFRGDKLVGMFNSIETRGFLWVLGKVKQGTITVKTAEGGETNFEIIRSTGKISPQIKKDRLTIKIKVHVVSKILNQSQAEDFTKIESLRKLKKIEANAIKTEIKKALQKANQLNTDIFGFGETIHRQYPKQWKKIEPQWEEYFPQIKVNMDIHTEIQEVGLSIKPPVPPRD